MVSFLLSLLVVIFGEKKKKTENILVITQKIQYIKKICCKKSFVYLYREMRLPFDFKDHHGCDWDSQ